VEKWVKEKPRKWYNIKVGHIISHNHCSMENENTGTPVEETVEEATEEATEEVSESVEDTEVSDDAPTDDEAEDAEVSATDVEADVKEALANGATDEDVMSSFGIDEARLAEIRG